MFFLLGGRTSAAPWHIEEHGHAVRAGAGWTLHPHVRLSGRSGPGSAFSQEGGLRHSTRRDLGERRSSAGHQGGAHHGNTGKRHLSQIPSAPPVLSGSDTSSVPMAAVCPAGSCPVSGAVQSPGAQRTIWGSAGRASRLWEDPAS